jgi:hypothetical protein
MSTRWTRILINALYGSGSGSFETKETAGAEASTLIAD